MLDLLHDFVLSVQLHRSVDRGEPLHSSLDIHFHHRSFVEYALVVQHASSESYEVRHSRLAPSPEQCGSASRTEVSVDVLGIRGQYEVIIVVDL